MKHIPVLLDRVLETLGDIRGKTIVDATFGAGGYTRAFLERGANIIAFDRDTNVVADADKIKQEYGDRFEFVLAPFSEIKNHKSKIINHIVFDFGISSMQIDTPGRGFSFRFDGPLDMRMSQSSEFRVQSAMDLVEQLSVDELIKILRDYGDVKKAVPIARAIKEYLPKTTFELRDLIHNPKDVAPVFQALRIAVNDELGEIERALAVVPDILPVGGMCVCVSFHSLEDRIVKNKFRELTDVVGDPRMPVIATPDFKLLKTYRPSEVELANNPRARSSHLRAVVKS
jgi:16S rRNA (cytosine1402-N4)-methyltransferase